VHVEKMWWASAAKERVANRPDPRAACDHIAASWRGVEYIPSAVLSTASTGMAVPSPGPHALGAVPHAIGEKTNE